MKALLFVIILPIMLAWFLVVGVVMLALWLVGFPITIKVNGVKTGYIRWFWYVRT